MQAALIEIDVYSKYVPVASTITSAVDILIKLIAIPILNQINKTIVPNSYYLNYVDKLQMSGCIIMLFPVISNILYFFIMRLFLDPKDGEVVNDEKKMLNYLKSRKAGIRDVGDKLKRNKDFFLKCYNELGIPLEHIFKYSHQYTHHAYPEKPYSFLGNDKTFMLDVIKKDNRWLAYLSPYLKSHVDFFLELSKFIDFQTLKKHANSEIFNNSNFMLYHLKVNPKNIQFMGDDLRKSNIFLSKALDFLTFKELLPYIDRYVFSFSDFMLAAINNDYNALDFIGDNLKTDTTLFLLALDNQTIPLEKLFEKIDTSLFNDFRFMLFALEKNKKVLNYLGENLKNNLEFLNKAGINIA